MDSTHVAMHRLLWLDLSSVFRSPPAEARKWQVETAADIPAAEPLLVGRPIRVGVFTLTEGNLAMLPPLERFIVRHWPMEWIALVEPGLLENGAVRELIRLWCHDFHTLPLDRPRLEVTLGHAFGMAGLRTGSGPGDSQNSNILVGDSPAIRDLVHMVPKVARVAAPVLITGESGTGKESVARAVHDFSPRQDGPYQVVNCGAVPVNLVSSELFGHERGAFTGAHRTRLGRVQAADRGTLFLDEIGDLPLEAQSSLLRFLENRTVQRVGGEHEEEVNVRVVAATHQDLETAVRAGRFREDLLYRLNVLHLHLPPLRARSGDALILARHFFRVFASDQAGGVKGFSTAAVEAIHRYSWPGNIRELINRVRRGMVLCDNRYILPRHMGLDDSSSDGEPYPTLEDLRADAERRGIRAALLACDGNVSAAARRLGVSRVTLYRLARSHGIHVSGTGSSRKRKGSAPGPKRPADEG